MTIEELNTLARDYESTILTHKLTKVELVSMLGILYARLYKKVLADAAPAEAAALEPPAKVKLPVVEEKKEVKYDSLYDPPPPMEVEKVPPRTEVVDGILTSAGTACVCDSCGKLIFMVRNDVKFGSKVSDLVEALTPMPGKDYKLPETLKIYGEHSRINIDCPGCGSRGTLNIDGKRKAVEE